MSRELDAPHRSRRSRSWLSDVAILVGGSAVGQGVSVLVLPITSRLFGPAELGAVGFFVAGVTIVYGVAAMRFDAAIPVPDQHDMAVDVLRVAIRCAIGVSLLTTIGGIILGARIGALVGYPALTDWFWLVGPTVFVASAFQTLLTWHTRLGAFKVNSIARLVHGVALAGGQVAVGVFGWGVAGLLFVPLLSWATATIVLLVPVLRMGTLAASRGSLRAVVRRYRRFPLISSWSVVFNRVSTEIGPVAIVALHSPEIAGLYLFAVKIVYRPVGMVSQSTAQVYFHRAARVWTTNPASLRPLILRVSRSLLAVVVVPAIVIVAFGPQIFALVLGDPWREAGRYASFLVPMAVAGLVSTSFAPTFFVTERQELQLIREILRLALIGTAVALAALLETTATVTVGLLATASAVGYILLFVTVWRAADVKSSASSTDMGAQTADENGSSPITTTALS